MKKRHATRQYLHRLRAMSQHPPYLHPYLDESGELQPVPFEVWEKASQICSGGRRYCCDAVWFGLRVLDPAPDTATKRYKGGNAEVSADAGSLDATEGSAGVTEPAIHLSAEFWKEFWKEQMGKDCGEKA